VTNAASIAEFCNKDLVEACSKLRVESILKAWNNVLISTNSVALTAELEVIKQWLKKMSGPNKTTEMEPCLPQSKSFLKVLDVPYCDSNTSLPINFA